MSYPRIRFPHGEVGKVRVKRGRGPRVARPKLAGSGFISGSPLPRQDASDAERQRIKEEEAPYELRAASAPSPTETPAAPNPYPFGYRSTELRHGQQPLPDAGRHPRQSPYRRT